MARWLVDKTKFYIPCPECSYAFGEMYENYIKGTANRKHYFFKCRKCGCLIETRKKSKLMDVYLDKIGSKSKVVQDYGSLNGAMLYWKKAKEEADRSVELISAIMKAEELHDPSEYVGEKGY